MDADKIIRVGEKNNFNQTQKEIDLLHPYKSKGKIFVNSNSFVKIRSDYPSVITINPYMTTEKLKGNISNVKALRIKVWLNSNGTLHDDCIDTILYSNTLRIPLLLTFMRFISKVSLERFDASQEYYQFNHGYYRPKKNTQIEIKKQVNAIAKNRVYICDENGTGCPDCMNCSKLTYDTIDCDLYGLNLSVSGKKDAKGIMGLCKFNCPDCYAKKINFGYHPACDKLIQNRKQTGKIKHI